MKRMFMILGAMLLVTAIVYPVFGHGPGWGRGHMMGEGWGPGSCWRDDDRGSSLSSEQRTQLNDLHENFYNETEPVRKDMWEKRKELDALMQTENPDREKVTSLQKDISALKARMAEKRLDFELDARKVAPDYNTGESYTRGYGRHMWGRGPHMKGYGRGGYGPGSCWN